MTVLGRRPQFVRKLRRQAARDVDWIQDLSREGAWVVVSGDRRITRNKAERDAFRASRLIGLFLSKGLQIQGVAEIDGDQKGRTPARVVGEY